MVLRAMAPQIIASGTKMTLQADLNAVCMASGCGVGLLATTVPRYPAELEQRLLYRQLLAERVFRLAVCIRRTDRGRRYEVEELLW